MKDGQCTKRFPKEFTPETVDNNDGYPAYRRRDNGRHLIVECPKHSGRQVRVDNRWVVGCCAYLAPGLKTYNTLKNLQKQNSPWCH